MKPGTLLISQPFLGDPNFERSVVLLCRHSPSEGAFGLVLTRRMAPELGDVLDLPLGAAAPAAALPLYEGGPVQLDSLHFVHRHAALPGATDLGQDVYWGGDFDHLITLINSSVISLNEVRCFVGYSGWSAGQLEEEIQRGSWIRQPASAGKVFTLEPDAFWQGILREKGGRFRALSNYPLDPRLN
ncbi:YqgE/AlgH family protein [Hymenobacter sp. HMF4947]|uniref:YqgE/AlgH family protein n=1 Tax=Hymenobacter ginkgonis TaxID=2682976 RepID=A0A7K1TBA5_9BACT|nr:YqgE/AlgH family protein [Hymenobacter ginkgonis]MVN75686.1 YqgE/AlgH family protein [Hymenobacter ginkgonis]